MHQPFKEPYKSWVCCCKGKIWVMYFGQTLRAVPQDWWSFEPKRCWFLAAVFSCCFKMLLGPSSSFRTTIFNKLTESSKKKLFRSIILLKEENSFLLIQCSSFLVNICKEEWSLPIPVECACSAQCIVLECPHYNMQICLQVCNPCS